MNWQLLNKTKTEDTLVSYHIFWKYVKSNQAYFPPKNSNWRKKLVYFTWPSILDSIYICVFNSFSVHISFNCFQLQKIDIQSVELFELLIYRFYYTISSSNWIVCISKKSCKTFWNSAFRKIIWNVKMNKVICITMLWYPFIDLWPLFTVLNTTP